VIGDCDGSYDFGQIDDLLMAYWMGVPLVLGNRFTEALDARAMPFSSRYLGNPALTWLVNRRTGLSLKDANTGFRAFSRQHMLALNLRAPGMEFALEMIIAARRAGLAMLEMPVRYCPRVGRSKLRPLRDGWRSLGVLWRDVRTADARQP
jgi:hypothetical protein